MAYEEVTSPIMLDSTGQQIHSDLQQIKNVLTTPSAAADITFDNTGTGMQADDVQDAITELKSNLIKYIDVTGTTDGSGNLQISADVVNPTDHLLLCAIPIRESGYYTSFFSCKIGTNANFTTYAIWCHNDVSSQNLNQTAIKV